MISGALVIHADDEYGGQPVYTDPVPLPPFNCDGDDPDTYDWDGYWDALVQEYAEWNADVDESMYLSEYKTSSASTPKSTSKGTVSVNVKNGVGLTSKGPASNVIGYSQTNGNNIIEVKINQEAIPPAWKQNAQTYAVLLESIREHEMSHISFALDKNPTIFQNAPAGYYLGYSTATRDASETNAWSDQVDFIEGVLDSGMFNGQPLSEDAMSRLQAIDAFLNQELQRKPWNG